MATLDDELVRHHTAAFGWALACCKWDKSAAGDVLQTAYLKIIDGRARFAGQSAFRTFLFGVIRHTAAEERRRRAIRSMLPLSVLQSDASAPFVDAHGATSIERDERSQALVAALNALPRRQRETLVLVFYHDLSIADAAQVLGVSLGSARVHYERGKTALRKVLRRETQ